MCNYLCCLSAYTVSLDDSSLKLQLEQRKQHAEDRLVIVHERGGPLDDEDGILEKIFSNITG